MRTDIEKETQTILNDLLSASQLTVNQLFVLGCSTSEVGGHCIGTASNEELAHEILSTILPAIRTAGAFMAVQCCEHLNRALVVERACMERFGLTQVWVKPWLHAGGAMAVEAYRQFDDPVVVEDLHAQAHVGMDIGGTLIGMHLRPVAVPVHTQNRTIGKAHVVIARTRPKYIGGPRAQYDAIHLAH